LRTWQRFFGKRKKCTQLKNDGLEGNLNARILSGSRAQLNAFVPDISPQYAHYLAHPMAQVALFIVASALMVWRLQAIEGKGFEGTVVGTLIMPYCSGFANLVFAYAMSREGGKGSVVIENCLVNNVTNLTLILGLSALFFGAASAGKKKAPKRAQQIYKLELLMTLVALFLFTGTLWALGKDRVLNRYDGMVLVGLFVFWQVLHVFEILKNNVRKNQSFQWSIVLDLLLVAAGAYGVYYSVDYLVDWVSNVKSAYISAKDLGWLSGILMVVPNAFIAMYFGFKGRQDVVVSSQVGDGHICIPMCIGLFALFDPITVPGYFQTGIYVLLAAGALNFISIATLGRLPKALGFVLVGCYAVFVYSGVVQR
jgi:cation:H+ antiporter